MLRLGVFFPKSMMTGRTGCGVCLFLLISCDTAVSQVPLLGRWQDFAYSADAVQAQAAIKYDALLADLRGKGQLDDDAELTQRVRRIATGLIDKAVEQKPSARFWRWEIHTTSEPTEEASSFSGGKLLFGTVYLRDLQLDDGELATLISHEVAHAAAEHQLEELSQVFYLNPGSIPITVETAMARLDGNLSIQIELATLLRIQEAEADQLGMMLAYNAGWPAASMVRFYKKLAARDSPTILSWAYPTVRSRVNMAQILEIYFRATQ
jgi:predicted Zn-dependent protease